MHYKIEYDNSDGSTQTLVGYQMDTDHPEVAASWLASVQPAYPTLRNMRLNDPAKQAIAEALRISGAGFEDWTTLEDDGFGIEELPYYNDQFGDTREMRD